MRRRTLPKYVTQFRDRHGKNRLRFRKKGHSAYYFKAAAWTDDFLREYHACLRGEVAPSIEPASKPTRPGSIDALVSHYYKSPEFQGLSDSTKKTYMGIIERFRAEYGSYSARSLERRHVKAIVGKRSATPAGANNLLRMIRMLMRFAIDIGVRNDDPTYRLKGFSIKSTGFHTWTEDEIAKFEATHPIGTRARLSFALMLYLGQRRSDVVRMGWQHIRDTRISVRQQKTGAKLDLPIHPDLAHILSKAERDNLTFLVTAHGKPFTPPGFGNWFRKVCDEAGLSNCSAHGLRKATARRLAEAGCTDRQIMSITGHKTVKEVTRYTREVDQRQLSQDALNRLTRVKTEQKMSNPHKWLDKNGSN